MPASPRPPPRPPPGRPHSPGMPLRHLSIPRLAGLQVHAGGVCVGCLFLRTPSRAPDRTSSACANRAAYPDPPPVVPDPESGHGSGELEWYTSVKGADVCICTYITFVPGYRCPHRCPVLSCFKPVPIKFKFHKPVTYKFHRPVMNMRCQFFFCGTNNELTYFWYHGTNI